MSMIYRVLYYRVDMDIVLACHIILGPILFQRPCLVLFNRQPRLLSTLSSSISLRDNHNWNAIIYILHELLANRTNFFAERSGEHHDLLAMRSASEYFLHVFAHICEWIEGSC